MTVFGSSEEHYGVMTPFLQAILADPDLRTKFLKANTSFEVSYSEPETHYLLDCSVDPPILITGPEALAHTAEVALEMSADDGHRFWSGRLNIPVALARRRVSVVGPLTKLMGLLPALGPAFGKYTTHLKEIGREDLLS